MAENPISYVSFPKIDFLSLGAQKVVLSYLENGNLGYVKVAGTKDKQPIMDIGKLKN